MPRFVQYFFWVTVVMTSVLTARVAKYDEAHIEVENPMEPYLEGFLEIPEDTHSDPKHQINKRETAVLPPPKIPESCKNQFICEHVENYPIALANLLWAQEKNKNNYVKDALYEPKELAQRYGEDKAHLCNSTLKVIPFLSARDSKDNWQYVMNLPNDPSQIYRMEVCSNNDSSHCNRAHYNPNYEGGCVQKYAYRMTYIINRQGKIKLESVKIPTCCSCVIKQKSWRSFIRHY